MKFSENWLRSFVNPALSSAELSGLLTMAGLEVEGMDAVAPAFNNVVVAQVLEVVKHPNADRLNVCQVNVGEAQPLTIVCGAANVAVGVNVPCARIGAVLPGDFNIKQAKVRGIESSGMLCSAKELGLAESSEGLWLLPDDAPIGKTLREYLDLDDRIYTLKLTPNRSDCSSLFGIAREVSALTASPCAPVDIRIQPVTSNEKLHVNVEDAQACPAYYGRLVRGVNAAIPTPVWMQRRLERSGLRSINAVVDITNYVMLEMGQPMHAFDAQKLSGGITVRRARAGESLTLLNEQVAQLDTEVLVIADDARVLAMAGIMGGKGSGVDTTSTNVFLESAFFHPDAIVGRARRFGLATDSSFRFERGVDYAATRQALERATQLLVEICGGQVGEISAVCGTLPARSAIALRRSRVARILGIELSNQQIADLLTRLRFAFTANGDDYRVTPPSFRFDMTIEADLVEELARLYGYDNIPAIAPKTALTMLPDNESQRPMRRIQQVLVARDYQEIVSLAFLAEQTERDLCGNQHPLTLQNPIASNLAVMRSSLIGGLTDALRYNLNRKQTRVRLFEVGACFAKVDNVYVQTQRLSGIAYGTALAEQWGSTARTADFYDVKADVEALFAPATPRFVAATHPALHPGRCAQILVGTECVGWLGELHPQWQQQYDLPLAPIWFELELDALLQSKVPRLQEIAKFLPVRRDIAVVVDERISVQLLLDAMTQVSAPLVQEVSLFDQYRGKGLESGKKSLAFRVLLQDTQKTLTEAEIETSITALVDALHQQGAQLRS
ncbi:MAG: phenylalanine--tRNA ligase subunit beta [Gallionella sp.]|jgi:phenylalanyl-tRNA synthetase beta chain|nr:phenylalanine--tRNA ligase subunit beta [Gallionella sp.]